MPSLPSLQYQSLITFDYPSLSITHHSRLTVEIARPSLSITRHKGFIQMQCWQAGAERSTFRALLRARFTQMLCPQACGLLQLPTKVRLRIYPYAPRASIITGDFPTVVTALQLVNRQVNAGVRPVVGKESDILVQQFLIICTLHNDHT